MRIWGFCGWNNFHLILVQPADNQQPPQNTWPIILFDELSRRLNIILLSFVFIKGHFAVWYTHLWTMTTHSESLFSIHWTSGLELWLDGISSHTLWIWYDGLETDCSDLMVWSQRQQQKMPIWQTHFKSPLATVKKLD